MLFNELLIMWDCSYTVALPVLRAKQIQASMSVKTPSQPHPHNITCGLSECEVTRLLKMRSAREWRQQQCQ